MGTFGNGRRIGMATTRKTRLRIRADQYTVRGLFVAAAVGTITLTTVDLRVVLGVSRDLAILA